MKFCSACGSPVEFRVPPGDALPRHVCPQCHAIHYQNPKVVVGSVVEWQGAVLLCRRAIEPRRGHWTLPAGFMENGESSAQAAIRETQEEACAQIEVDGLFALVNIPGIDQIHLFYRGRLSAAEFAPGPESLETALFPEADIPWNDLAFGSVAYCLETYFADRKAGMFSVHESELPALGPC